MSYEKCRAKFLSNILEEFKRDKLRDRGGNKVKKREQALAIALNYAQNKCKYSDKELKKVEEKVNKFLEDNGRLVLTNIIETKVLINNLIEDGNRRRARRLQELLWRRIVNGGLKGHKISNNILRELREIDMIIN